MFPLCGVLLEPTLEFTTLEIDRYMIEILLWSVGITMMTYGRDLNPKLYCWSYGSKLAWHSFKQTAIVMDLIRSIQR